MFREIAITGTRSIALGTDTDSIFASVLLPFVPSTVPHDLRTRFWLGGAIGIDTLALRYLADHTVARLVVVVPGTVDDQPGNARRVIAAYRLRNRLEEVIELKAGPSPHCNHVRNRYLVDHAGLVIGFPVKAVNTENRKGGTWSTLAYAHSQGKPHLIVPVGI